MSPHSPSPGSGQRYQASILRRAKRDPGEQRAGQALGLIVSLLAIVVLTAFLNKQSLTGPDPCRTAVFAVLVDSWAFALATIVLQHGTGLSLTDWKSCSAAIVLCLTLYITTKSVCLFLTERAFIVRNGSKRRLESKLYLFNSAGLVLSALLAAGEVERLAYGVSQPNIPSGEREMHHRGTEICACASDLIYLTTLFLIPLRHLNASTGMLRNPANIRLRSIAIRTFIGSCLTATSSIVLVLRRGDPVGHQMRQRNRGGSSCGSDHHHPDTQGHGDRCCCFVSETGPYDAAAGRRRSSSATAAWCCRRPSDGTTIRATSLMMRRDSLASVCNGNQPPPPPLQSHPNSSSSSDYHSAVASAGPIHWDNIFSLFSHEDGQDKQLSPKETVAPGTLEAAPVAAAPATDEGGAPAAAPTIHTTATSVGATEVMPLQRPKPSRALSSIRSIRSVVMGDELSQAEQGQRPGGGEESCEEKGQ
ncbi:hypothetical protein PG999_002580 [Apiospora kogelbergensis]|uniref:Uncharacterized protein n=1 Tax=Apiospora kogelbergensis TaxID=1337665 RepID=A0AAW0R8R5_9PEZI